MERDKFFWAVVIISVISFAYWAGFAANAMFTFHEYTDVSVYAWSMYYDIHFPQISNGLQLLIFGNHLSPDNLLVMPFYYIAQSPMTLLIVQDFVVTLAALAVYFVAKDLLKSKWFPFFLFAAFILNPGMHGILIFDYHTEMFIPLAYILTFYFIMKCDRKWLAVSLALLLGSIEEGPYIAISLAVGIIAYEFFLDKGGELRQRRLRLGIYTIIASVAVLAAYWLILHSLLSGYSAGAYAQLPPYLKAMGYDVAGGGSSVSSIGSALSFAGTTFSGPLGIFLIYGLVVAFLSFGTAWISIPLITLWLQLPWLAGLFLGQDINLFFIFNYYFSLALGPIIVSSILGIMAFNSNKTLISKLVNRLGAWSKRTIYISSIAAVLIIFALSPIFVYSKNVNNFSQDFLFQINGSVMNQTRQLHWVMGYIPKNAAVMVPFFTMPYFINREYLELTPTNIYYFKPEYILSDFNLNISLNSISQGQLQGLYSIIVNNTVDNVSEYGLCVVNGSAALLALSNLSSTCPTWEPLVLK